MEQRKVYKILDGYFPSDISDIVYNYYKEFFFKYFIDKSDISQYKVAKIIFIFSDITSIFNKSKVSVLYYIDSLKKNKTANITLNNYSGSGYYDNKTEDFIEITNHIFEYKLTQDYEDDNDDIYRETSLFYSLKLTDDDIDTFIYVLTQLYNELP